VKLLLAVLAGLVALAGLGNFFAALNGLSPIPIAVSHPVAILAIAYLLFQHIFPATIYRAGAEARSRSLHTLEASGALLAQTTCGGAIGSLQFRGPFLRVVVYPGGIVFKPLLMPAAAIHNHELTTIRLQKLWLGEELELCHRSELLVSPIRLGCGSTDPVATVLLSRGQAPAPSA
jgi:hypothetical protein